jgi:hypothetical protein
MWDIRWDLWKTRNYHKNEHEMTTLLEEVSKQVDIMLEQDLAIVKGSKYRE